MRYICMVALATLLSIGGCGEGDSDRNIDTYYYVQNDSTVSVSLIAIGADTTITFNDIAPHSRVRVGQYASFYGTIDIEFFHCDTFRVEHAGTVLDQYLASDTARNPHICSWSDYVETGRNESGVDRVFTLFPQ